MKTKLKLKSVDSFSSISMRNKLVELRICSLYSAVVHDQGHTDVIKTVKKKWKWARNFVHTFTCYHMHTVRCNIVTPPPLPINYPMDSVGVTDLTKTS